VNLRGDLVDRGTGPRGPQHFAALTYRFATFYLPPIWGLRCFRWLAARHYL